MSDTYSNSPLNDKGVDHFDIPINNRESQPISPMAHSRRRIAIDPLVSLALVLPSNLGSLDLVISCNSNDICVGKLFSEKNELILELCKVALRDKFDFKIAVYNDTL